MDWQVYSTEASKDLRRWMIPQDVDILLAADVVYDVHVIGCLSQTVLRFLHDGDKRMAIIATSVRNKKTFDLFEAELHRLRIVCTYVNLDRVPRFLPGYHVRSGIRLCEMTLSDAAAGLQ